MWWPFRSTKDEPAPPPPPDTGDWSLRANGDTYRDRQYESDLLINRLSRSTASVTGIAGQRGAGKSSLALRVLSEAKKRGAFTLLIHSPTGYDPREFLVAVFRRICEEVISNVRRSVGEADSLSERARDLERRLRGTLWAILLGVSFVFVSTGGYTTFRFYQIQSEMEAEDLKSFQAEMDAREKRLQTAFDELTAKSSRTEAEEENLREVTDELKYTRERREDLLERGYLRSRQVTSSTLFVFAPLMVVAYASVFVAIRVTKRLRRQLSIAQEQPLETGLRDLATELLEHLQYQTKLTASGEASVGFLKAASKLTRGKELASRPISLPGLTAQLAAFLERVSEVYANTAVICLDELDKIENPNELDELLRGIKGILGQKHTHFLLTVSEDALARFTTRRRMDRGMLESAFEDIILLERVELDTAAHMLDLMYPEGDRTKGSDEPHVSTLLFWVFGSGIPREIKRNALSCLEAGIIPTRTDGSELWSRLFLGRLETIRSWAARVGKDDQTTYSFLRTLENTLREYNDTLSQAVAIEGWYCSFVAEWKGFFDASFAHVLRNDQVDEQPDERSDAPSLVEYALARAVLELVIGASGVYFALDKLQHDVIRERSLQLLSVFEFIPTNVAFASDLCWEYIQAVEVGGALASNQSLDRSDRLGGNEVDG